jgi:hypothetical protein
VGNSFSINDIVITVAASPNNTVTQLVTSINAALNASGVYAANIGGKLTLYADSSATNDGSTEGTGVIAINNISGTPLATLGITGGEYAAPAYFPGANYQAPRWRSTDTQPEPTGSVFQQTNATNQGMLIQIKRYDATLGAVVLQMGAGRLQKTIIGTSAAEVGDMAPGHVLQDSSIVGVDGPRIGSYRGVVKATAANGGLAICGKNAPSQHRGGVIVRGDVERMLRSIREGR